MKQASSENVGNLVGALWSVVESGFEPSCWASKPLNLPHEVHKSVIFNMKSVIKVHVHS